MRSPTQSGYSMLPSRPAWRRVNSPPSVPVQSFPAVPPRYRFHQAASRPIDTDPSSTWPSGPYATPPTGPKGRAGAGPPSSGTARAQLRRREASP